MALPVLSIPELPANINIPVAEMLHPVITHFAIAVPVIIVLFEIINLAAKRKAIGVMSFIMMLIVASALYAALLSGEVDAKRAGDMIGGAKELLDAHKQAAIYLFYASLLLIFIKLLSVVIQKTALKIVFLLVALIFTASIFSTAKKGCMLVFQHGVNVKSADSTQLSSPVAKTRMPAETNASKVSVPQTDVGQSAKEAASPEANGSGNSPVAAGDKPENQTKTSEIVQSVQKKEKRDTQKESGTAYKENDSNSSGSIDTASSSPSADSAAH